MRTLIILLTWLVPTSCAFALDVTSCGTTIPARQTGILQNDLPTRLLVTPATGVPGDAWGRREQPDPVAQITVMQVDVATLIANGHPLELFGDNLFLELDLSVENLPIGSRLRLGSATVAVTPKAHNGCRKFQARFGPEALRFVSDPELRHRNLRGIYLRVLEAGEVAVGDAVEVIARG
jgi:MOSC domain-containing protein YiiM